MLKTRLKTIPFALMIVCLVCAGSPASGGVSEQEADRLKKDLTPVGAERAGNADGTIPAWEGGMTAIPDHVDYDPASGKLLPDPFADDKILFTITAQNMDQYAGKLSEGQKAFFKKYPESFKMNVYPTHRTYAAPQWLYDNTYKNALSSAELEDGMGLTGAWGGYPFPIPKNGRQALYNHICRWRGKGVEEYYSSYIVYPDGSLTMGGAAQYTFAYPYYASESKETWNGFIEMGFINYDLPERRKGEVLMGKVPLDYTAADRMAWQYIPGVRRVRRAPNLRYDTPNPSTAGLATFDESIGIADKLDRFDFTLVGKKELFVPYNNYRNELVPTKDFATPYHANPDHMRWELHRVWVVEGTLREGFRHCYGKMVYFVDEDSWIDVMDDKYDTRGELWRVRFYLTQMNYHSRVLRIRASQYHDLRKHQYASAGIFNDNGKTIEKITPDSFFTPQNVRKYGRR